MDAGYSKRIDKSSWDGRSFPFQHEADDSLFQRKLIILLATMVFFITLQTAVATSTELGGCANNLRILQGAIEQWSLEHKVAKTNAYSLSDTNIWEYLKNHTLPLCPGGGVYRAGNTVADEPSCSVHSKASNLTQEIERRTRRGERIDEMIAVVGIFVVLLVVFFAVRAVVRGRRTSA